MCGIWQRLEAALACQLTTAELISSFRSIDFQHLGPRLAYRLVLTLLCCGQVLCNEAGVPVREMRDDDVAARELSLDSKMRAFFRLSNFSHRCCWRKLSTCSCQMLATLTPMVCQDDASASPKKH